MLTGLLKISGAKAKDLLQGQLTCDVNEVTTTESRLGAHCNPQGRIISLFQLFYLHDHYYLLMPREMVPIALNALKKYAIFFKGVTLEDASDESIKLNLRYNSISIYPETTEKFLPHELNLHLLGAISFNKGCYTGQEIIARMHYRAKLKNHLYLAEFDPTLKITRGSNIFNHKGIAGDIVDYQDNYLYILTKDADAPLFLDENLTNPILGKLCQLNYE